ncbi:Hsp20/alpha crystallin family protein [Nitratidesulfovibrio sp. SRB-5]|uniref:Hsp20/alpha crystallin family protein n=1 Tax=Nitratidesulfovibrio sp. SRB-5 TaxID=2872636 RepID=UPI00102880D8|nr:Hsp20/alpha crystallin family protein [Nitratidesulfovibrio sp. SRB-5]MBZ2173198.1 Hsp20/alpha crystallin family protein [Nitratidesulfovibrio sp. SRB-5]RXF75730.1 Hsp20/alpha crystallin family protein [Desulfovibrio sp. DS-1]
MKLDALHPRNWFRRSAEREDAGSDRHDDGRLAAPVPYDVECANEKEKIRRLMELAGAEELLYETLPHQPAECGFEGTRRLAVDIAVEDDAYLVMADVPGLVRMSAGDRGNGGIGDESHTPVDTPGHNAGVDVRVDGRRLFITGRMGPSPQDKGRGWQRMERRTGTFRRILVLPDDAVAEGIATALENGVLTVSIPRASSEECVWVPGEDAPRAGCHA